MVTFPAPGGGRYRALLSGTQWAFERLRIGLFLVAENGSVTTEVEPITH